MGDPEELDELEERELEDPERLEADEELEPLDEPELDPELLLELELQNHTAIKTTTMQLHKSDSNI